jgi:predicted Zn-dependent protease
LTLLEFPKAKAFVKKLAKKYKINNWEEWLKFTESKGFSKYSKIIPKDPWTYFSEESVEKRIRIEKRIRKENEKRRQKNAA